jgi:hypothetical protein
MKNPWTKKNPFLSMWLSGANSVAGAARGRASAEAKRQGTKAMQEGTRQMMNFWSGGMLGHTPPKSPAKKRKRR